ncbi:MAG: hypothetical protein GC200_04495 [Tepidisphaera sp.]|nr:hypothetical protein [Tepidisphaera sp.]
MARCHLNSYGDKLARGMSWPLNVTSILAALEHRPEADIWLSAYRRNTAQSWLPYRGVDQCPKEAHLVSIEYTSRRVEWKRRWSHRFNFLPLPAWFDLDDPPLIDSSMYSIPAGLMRDTGLTKSLAAGAVSDSLRSLLPKSITDEDWKLELLLRSMDPAIVCRRYEHPLTKWTLVSTRTYAIETRR